MIGCAILGGLVALAVAKFVRHRHGCHAYGYAGPAFDRGCWGGRRWRGGPDEWGPEAAGPEGGGQMGWGRRWFIRGLVDRLQASPAQARTIWDAVSAFQSEIQGLRGEAKRTRSDLAAALRKPAFDEVLLGELYARHDNVIEQGRKALVGLMARVHEVLEEEQRERLARMIESGSLGGGRGWYRN